MAADSFEADIDNINRIPAVPTILEMVSQITGMRFAAVARVTGERWIACSVLDRVDFGLKPGDELRIETTICNEIQQSRQPVIINHVEQDAYWRQHHTPRMYGFQSYISVPIIMSNGQMFGTLCAIDPKPAQLTSPAVLGTFRLFAELISKHLEARRYLTITETALEEERAEGELREQFIAVLGHDLRTPMRAITCMAELLLLNPNEADVAHMSTLIRDSAKRMNGLIDNMLDLTLARLGDGLHLRRDSNAFLEPTFRQVIAEQQAGNPSRQIVTELNLPVPVTCDTSRIAQILANLLSNALAYGDKDAPVTVAAASDETKFSFSVTNAGERIPSEVLERIFQPFYRHSMSRAREGLGLGLYISHQIAEAHGATLTVTSDDAETRFTLSMALASGD